MPRFEIHAIDRETYDAGNDCAHRRASFTRHVGTTNYTNDLGYVTHCDLDGGLLGVIEAPEGSVLGEMNSGDTILMVPEAEDGIPADDVLAMARRRVHGLRLAK